MSGSRFIGGPCDGEMREVADEPSTYFVSTASGLGWGPEGPTGTVTDHRYLKRVNGAYYEYAGVWRVHDVAE